MPDYRGPEPPEPIRLTVSGKELLQVGLNDWVDTTAAGGLAADASEAIRRSGWLADPAGTTPVSEMKVQVVQYQFQGPGLIPFLTAFVIPGFIDHRIELRAELVSPGGSSVECSRSIETRSWYQTLLIFVYPFRSPAHARMKATEALALQCASELLRTKDPAALGDAGGRS